MPAKTKAQEEAEDVLLLADLIGIGQGEAEYLWIAKEAFNADLPPGWQIFFDEEGRSFFFEVNKQISSYEHPSLDYYRKLYADFKRKDAEFGEQQRQQEIAFALREEATGGTTKADTQADAAGGLQRPDSEGDTLDPDAERIREEQNKTRLLQAYSNDPNLASKYRADIQEREDMASQLLKKGIQKEEEVFLKRLRLYVDKKHHSSVETVEGVIVKHQREQEEKIEAMAESLTKLMQEVKDAALAGPPDPRSMPRGQSAHGHAVREQHHLGERGPTSPNDTELRTAKRLEKMKAMGGNASQVSYMPGCESCKSLSKQLEDLTKQNEELKAAAEAAGPGGTARFAAGSGEVVNVEAGENAALLLQVDDLQRRDEKQKKELVQLKQMLAAGLGRAITQDEHRAEMDDLAEEARRLDVLGASAEVAAERPVTAPALPGGAGGGAGTSGGGTGPPPRPQSGPAHVAELMTASGLTNEAILDLLERMEAMTGGEAGPLQELRGNNQKLHSNVSELEGENGRRMERIKMLEEEAEAHIKVLAKAEAVKLELRRSREHSEHMEFLASQYSEQCGTLQASLNELKARVLEEERSKGQTQSATRTKAQAEHAVTQPAKGKAHADVPRGGNFSVRVRRQTLLDVKSRASTLKTAVSLLRIDFQAYAEGIFLPLARELHQNTLNLAASLSSRSRDLRVTRGSLAASLAAQRILEANLEAVYSIAFHTIAYLAPLDRARKGMFREPLAKTLTLQLREGFENSHELLETHEFDKVFGPEMDGAAVFHEMTPYLSRVVNWRPVCIIVRGGRESNKDTIALEAEYLDDKGQTTTVPGLLERVVSFMADVYLNEVDHLLKTHQTDDYDLQLSEEYSEVLDDSVFHYIGKYTEDEEEAAASDAGADASGGGGGGSGVNLFDMQGMLGGSLGDVTAKKGEAGDMSDDDDVKEASKKGSDAGAEGGMLLTDELVKDDDADSVADDELEEAQGRKPFVPSRSVETAAEASKLLQEALRKAAGRMAVKQQEMDRQASEKVQRAKRVAKPGHRNLLGERVQEPHRILTVRIIKRDRATDERQVGLIKVVVLGAPAEVEDSSTDATRFRKEHDVSRHTLSQFLERKHLRQTDPGWAPGDSALTDMVFDTLAPESAVVLVTAVSPVVDDFEDTIEDLRFASRSTRQRPTTSARLERVKFKWQNGALVWAFTLWKGAVADSEKIQLSHQLENQKEEIETLRSEVVTMTAKLESMAEEGLAYMSDDDKEAQVDDDVDDAGDQFLATRNALEKVLGKSLMRLQEKQDGAVLQAVVGKLRYQQAQKDTLAKHNRELGRILHSERARVRVRGLGNSLPGGLPGAHGGGATPTPGRLVRGEMSRASMSAMPRSKSAMSGGVSLSRPARAMGSQREAWTENEVMMVHDKDLAASVLSGAASGSMDASQLSGMQTRTLPPAHKRQALGSR